MHIVVQLDPVTAIPYTVVYSSRCFIKARNWVKEQDDNYTGPLGWQPRYEIYGRLTEW